jgi:hypothetical protein
MTSVTITPDTLQAIRLLGSYTANRFDLWQLAGRAHAMRRAHVLGTLTGTKVSQAKAGITAMRTAFYARLGIVGQCEAEREENFRFVCHEADSSPRP